MKTTIKNRDYIVLTEDNIYEYTHIDKVHLIKLDLKNPNTEILEKILHLYKNTNRFIINNNIRFYNHIFKKTNKKYYVENTEETALITFFRKNNKVLLNLTILNDELKTLLLKHLFIDILKNIEVIIMSSSDFKDKENELKHWYGNVIIDD